MIKVERFINELMSSNCYIVADEASKHCICIDPASEKSLREIEYIESNGLTLDYIILTHEHTDHTWGVNSLTDKYPYVKVICSELCKQALHKEAKVYFQLYFDNPDYIYNVRRVDYTAQDLGWKLAWMRHNITFVNTPGHSPGSIVVEIDGVLFGGDTLMPFKPFIKKRNGGSKDLLKQSALHVKNLYSLDSLVYPGHGETLPMKDILVYLDK